MLVSLRLSPVIVPTGMHINYYSYLSSLSSYSLLICYLFEIIVCCFWNFNNFSVFLLIFFSLFLFRLPPGNFYKVEHHKVKNTVLIVDAATIPCTFSVYFIWMNKNTLDSFNNYFFFIVKTIENVMQMQRSFRPNQSFFWSSTLLKLKYTLQITE